MTATPKELAHRSCLTCHRQDASTSWSFSLPSNPFLLSPALLTRPWLSLATRPSHNHGSQSPHRSKTISRQGYHKNHCCGHGPWTRLSRLPLTPRSAKLPSSPMSMPQPPETDRQSFCSTTVELPGLEYGKTREQVVLGASKHQVIDQYPPFGPVSVWPATG